MNILSNIPQNLPAELIETLASKENVRIERIVSRGHVSDDWYDQETNEFVFVVAGEAKIVFEDDDVPLHLKAGDYLSIVAHLRHKVVWTQPDVDTVWLAIHY